MKFRSFLLTAVALAALGACTAKPPAGSVLTAPASPVAASPSPTPKVSLAPGASPTPTVAPATPAAPAAVSFKADVAPLLASSCAGCHTPGGEGSDDIEIFSGAGEVRYDTVSGDMGTIIRQVQAGRMPRHRTPLSADEIALLKRWHDAGNPNN